MYVLELIDLLPPYLKKNKKAKANKGYFSYQICRYIIVSIDFVHLNLINLSSITNKQA